jgi:hypothetical protein
VVTAKLPERDGAFEYRIRSALEEHERMVRIETLKVLLVDDLFVNNLDMLRWILLEQCGVMTNRDTLMIFVNN